tara:strand:+ start:902 stop:1345 length:444 start_codon:yes stop_codon:yes gene_type:complete
MPIYFKNKFSLIFIINYSLLSFLIPNTAYSQLICNSEVKFDKLDKKYKKYTFCEESNSIEDAFNQALYKNSHNQVQSQKISSQLDDFFGVKYLFSKEKTTSGFPENRIVRDSELVWETYNIFLDKQLNPITKNTNDIYNGFNSSIGN